eukprot:7153584-Pyramimonas_sp.AAC.1
MLKLAPTQVWNPGLLRQAGHVPNKRFGRGMLTLITAYAPQSGLDYETRQAFHYELQNLFWATSTHNTTMACGDFNA